LFWNEPKYIDFFHVLPALQHHTYSEDDVEEGGIKNNNFFRENSNFFRTKVGKNKKFFLKFLFQITTFGCRRVPLNKV
jgi:hypothetical protein